MRRHAIIAAALLAIAPPLFAQTTTQPAGGDFDALIRDLASPNFPTRDAAQKKLDAVPADFRDSLQRLAKSTPDPEVRARLAMRLLQINESLASNPPEISLRLQNATLDEVAQALSKELGKPITALPAEPSIAPGTFTLTTKGSLWTIINELSKQHPLTMISTEQGLAFSLSSAKTIYQPVAGFAVAPDAISRFVNTNFAVAARGTPLPQFSFVFRVVADPRVLIAPAREGGEEGGGPAIVTPPTIITGNGTVITARFTNIVPETDAKTPMWKVTANLAVPANVLVANDKIASFKGQLQFQVAMPEHQLEIANPVSQINQPITFAGAVITVTKWEVTDRGYTIAVKADKPANSPPITFTIFDATGKNLTAFLLTGSTGSTRNGPVSGPLKFELSAPPKPKPVTIPFEFKDIPLR